LQPIIDMIELDQWNIAVKKFLKMVNQENSKRCMAENFYS